MFRYTLRDESNHIEAASEICSWTWLVKIMEIWTDQFKGIADLHTMVRKPSALEKEFVSAIVYPLGLSRD